MFQQTSYTDQLTFMQKLRGLDIWLIICILALGAIGAISMYSSEGGELLYHTKNHIIRFTVFFLMMLVLSFLRINFLRFLSSSFIIDVP